MRFDSASLMAGIKKEIPKFKIVDKRKSFFMKFLNVFVRIFNPKFMGSFITTIGFTVYWPDPPKNFDRRYSTLWHEARHALQAKKWTRFFFGWLYLFPQSLFPLAFLSLLSIWFSSWWLLFLAALIFLAPWPAPWRVRWELQAFEAQIHCFNLMGFSLSDWIDYKVNKTFCGWDYYKMSWSKKRIRRKLEILVKFWEEIRCPFGEVVAEEEPWE